MPRFTAVLHGTGRTEVTAFGPADAEARVEKELTRAVPSASVRIVALRPTDPEPRIVQLFEVEFALTLRVEVEAARAAGARHLGLAAGRRSVLASRFSRVAWERVEIVDRSS